jgi:DNA-binding beta-propeller fold protein YncE
MTRPAAVLALLAALAAPAVADDRLPMKKTEILLDGASTFRGMALDAAAGRIYLSHGSVVDVVDLAKGDSIGTVEGVDRARGVVVVPDLKRGYAVSAKKNRLLAFELETRKVLKEIPVGDGPDAALWVSAVKEVWVFNQKTNDVTCVDPASMEVKGTIKLAASPRGAVENPNTGQVFVALVEPDSIGVLEPRSKRVLDTHPLEGGEPVELAFNAKHGLLYVGCENQQLFVLEIIRWKAIFKSELDSDVGAIAYDPGTAKAYVVCTSGTLVTTERSPKWVVKLDKGLDTPGGGAAVFDGKAKRLYVAMGPPKGEEGRVQILVFQQP